MRRNSLYSNSIRKSDYYPFGMVMWGRNFNTRSYRFGFNGKENDNEVKGSGNSIDFGARIYDPRLGRFLSIDPDAQKYAYVSISHELTSHFTGN